MTDIVERLEAHMGKAEIQDVLPDCREAAAEIRRLRAKVQQLEGQPRILNSNRNSFM